LACISQIATDFFIKNKIKFAKLAGFFAPNRAS